jgi:hypothetical protein
MILSVADTSDSSDSAVPMAAGSETPGASTVFCPQPPSNKLTNTTKNKFRTTDLRPSMLASITCRFKFSRITPTNHTTITFEKFNIFLHCGKIPCKTNSLHIHFIVLPGHLANMTNNNFIHP